ncbi:MAG TPA: ChrR family anti-sigma-E factor [Shinella sp.]|jgi:putative transcriptional regulator|uniref:ChrR family anti-sigma-E factor n=1 Tax=Shinella sp. TaxID=1870904 RepID=UPI0029B71CF5|nr:ChrR family anti-sigma-E factor [Shinella sp.]MDX3975133.1 ChrR family anti-sigma-E factor [Shinella sp.]HEV7249517.1 ChrR family anti-sigma-E factor [Shinella sp.]
MSSKHHHATDETLMRYAAGTLAAGPAIVVEAHLAACPACRARVATYEAVGGALLDEIEPTALSETAFNDVLAMIDAEEGPAPRPQSRKPVEIEGVRLPDALGGCDIGRWRWIGPGMRMSRVGVPHDPDANLILLKIGPGRALPDHGHAGTEFTYVVAGAFSDRFGTFGPGDMAEMDEDVEHQPIVDRGGDCICLAAMEGQMRFKGFIGRMLQPIFGI